ncbi:hydroxymethylbilane synthase [Bartonella tamiae]|uniref:Hydroxymethylbilane synthase n=1 Tax=Bartonella tamiae Th239 TaxID=1094558 RepID=J0R5T5_9HYPH|nr:hydroxymethylbilane synthase [Bartonella tamiae]EJF91059.1 porphobilinogen deaminase [Bartonella tamiae Th239]EJF93276.1 porphobilinogen deaminase [Bartonella tamiae Th307]
MRIRLGTRKSALARVQADKVAHLLHAVDPNLNVEMVFLGSKGDADKRTNFQDIGSVGVFTKSGEDALINREVDIVVHSLKDLPTTQPEGLVLASVPEREDPRDVLCGLTLDTIRSNRHKIGTGSIRRAAQLRAIFPDITVVPVRGNVPPRLRRAVEKNGIDATILAAAGLKRLGLMDKTMEYLNPQIFPYAVAQGALGIECRESDKDIIQILKKIECKKARAETDAERALMKHLGAGCNLPVGVCTSWKNTMLHMKATVTGIDGLQQIRDHAFICTFAVEKIGQRLAERLLDKGAGELLRASGINQDTAKVARFLKT